jgi:hypothetical protein
MLSENVITVYSENQIKSQKSLMSGEITYLTLSQATI